MESAQSDSYLKCAPKAGFGAVAAVYFYETKLLRLAESASSNMPSNIVS